MPFQAYMSSNSFKIQKLYAAKARKQLPKLAPWGFTAAVVGAWLVYEALSEEWKAEVGLPSTFKLKA